MKGESKRAKGKGWVKIIDVPPTAGKSAYGGQVSQGRPFDWFDPPSLFELRRGRQAQCRRDKSCEIIY